MVTWSETESSLIWGDLAVIIGGGGGASGGGGFLSVWCGVVGEGQWYVVLSLTSSGSGSSLFLGDVVVIMVAAW